MICAGGLGVQDDEDTSVRGTVSLNSISLGLKKVNIGYENHYPAFKVKQAFSEPGNHINSLKAYRVTHKG